MDTSTIQRYQSGGDIYATLTTRYGQAGAELVASAAMSGDMTQVQSALTNLKDGTFNGDTSTYSILASQLYNEPLNAPIEQASKIAVNTVTAAGTAAKNITGAALGNWGVWIIGGLVIIGLFFYFGGAAIVRSQISKKAA